MQISRNLFVVIFEGLWAAHKAVGMISHITQKQLKNKFKSTKWITVKTDIEEGTENQP